MISLKRDEYRFLYLLQGKCYTHVINSNLENRTPVSPILHQLAGKDVHISSALMVQLS